MRSGAAAAAWLEQRTSFPFDEDGITQCMRAVLMAFDLVPIDGYGSAMDGWELNGIPSTIANASFRRGTVHHFRGPFGHVGIATGNGTEVRSTGVHTTSMLTATAADMARLTGDPYLGYATSFSGRAIDFTSTAGDSVTPFPPVRRINMPQNFVQEKTGDGKGGKDSLWMTIGLAGQNGPGQVRKFIRTINDGSNFDQGAMAVKAHGDGTIVSKAEFETLEKLYSTPASIGTVTTTPDQALLAAVLELVKATQANGVLLTALPAEIDRYADGKKQS